MRSSIPPPPVVSFRRAVIGDDGGTEERAFNKYIFFNATFAPLLWRNNAISLRHASRCGVRAAAEIEDERKKTRKGVSPGLRHP
jgi:hypothetical protein